MLSSLSNFLFNATASPLEDTTNLRNNANSEYLTQELEDDWLLVDKLGDEKDSNLSDFSDTEIPDSPSPSPDDDIVRNIQNQVPRRSRNPALKLYVPISTPEYQGSPPSSPNQQMDGSWYVTPPPCFTARLGHVMIETSPMENLLIEHPSMSVYGPIMSLSSFHGLRNYNTSDVSSTDSNLNVWISTTPRLPSLERNVSREPREGRQSQRVHHRGSLSSNLDAVALEERRSILEMRAYHQQGEQRNLKPSYLKRQNLARQYQSTKRQRNQQLLKQPVKFCNRRC